MKDSRRGSGAGVRRKEREERLRAVFILLGLLDSHASRMSGWEAAILSRGCGVNGFPPSDGQ
jgi:hypothetical protein